MSFSTLADLRAADRLYRSADVVGQASETGDTWGLVATALPTVATTPGTVHTNDSASLFTLPDTGTTEKYLTEWMVMTAANTNEGAYSLCDRLVSVSQAITTTGVKTINSSALPRYTTGDGVMVWAEVSTVTATNVVVMNLNSYTNQSGATGHSGASVSFPTNATNVGSWIQLPLQAGDWGVRSVESINVTTASGGAGAINVVLVKPLDFSGVAVGSAIEATLKDNLVPIRIYDGACLTILTLGYAGAERMDTAMTFALS